MEESKLFGIVKIDLREEEFHIHNLGTVNDLTQAQVLIDTFIAARGDLDHSGQEFEHGDKIDFILTRNDMGYIEVFAFALPSDQSIEDNDIKLAIFERLGRDYDLIIES